MKSTRCILVGVTGLALATSAPAKEPVSLLLGTWALDVASLPVPPEAKPKSVTIAFSDAGDAKWTTDVTIVSQDGSVSHSSSTHPLDGTPATVVGNNEADMVSVKVAAPDVLIMALSKGGEPRSMRVFNVRPDGKSETETMVYFRPDGTPAMRTTTFTRIR